jgi:hypothetical protein
MLRRFCRELGVHGIQHDSFSGAADLQQAIAQYIEYPGWEPRPFVWTVGASDTAQVVRARAALARWTISAEENGAPQHETGVTAACA